MNTRMRRTWLALVWLTACASASGGGLPDPTQQNPSQPHPPGEPVQVNAGGNAADALLMTGLAVGASAGQRSQGGCYANCPPGTVCNPATGLCDTQPCHGRCGANETCDLSGPFPKCVQRAQPDLGVQAPAP